MKFSDVFRNSLHVFAKHWRVLVSAALLVSILPMVALSGSYLLYYGGEYPAQFTMWDVIIGLASWGLSLLLTLSVLEFLRSRNRNLQHAINAGARRLWDGVLLTIIMSIALFFLFLLLIIPGIIFSIYWIFAYYALIMDEKSIIESLRHSTSVVRGNWWRILGYLVLVTLILIGASLIVLIPVFILGWLVSSVNPLAAAFFAMTVSTAINALALVYLLIFLERMYVALR